MIKAAVAVLSIFYGIGGSRAFALSATELDATAKSRLSSIESSSKSRRYETTGQLGNDLSEAFNKGVRMTNDTRERLCSGLIAVYQGLGASKEDLGTKQEIVAIETAHCTSASSKQFIFRVMETEPDSVRRFVLTYLGDPDGLRDEELYSKMDEWSAKGFMKKSARPTYWVRMKGRGAVPDILKTINATQDREEVLYAAWALQGVGSVEDMKVAYRKARQVHLDKPIQDAPDGLYWVKDKFLIEYVRSVDGDDLKDILQLMAASSALVPAGVVPILTTKLKTAGGETEILLIRRLTQAAENPRIDHDQVIRAFQEKLSEESDPKTKDQLSGSLKEVEGKKAAAKKFLDHEQEWIKRNRK